MILSLLKKFYVAVILSFFTVFFLFPIAIVAYPFSQRTRNKIIHPFWPAYSWCLMRIGFLCRFETIDRRTTDEDRKLEGLFISNHESILDIPLVAYKYPLAPMMKKEILKVPFFGIIALVSGGIVVDRKNQASREKAFRECVKRLTHPTNPMPVMYYPEGTRSLDGRPKPFKDIKIRLMYDAFERGIKLSPVTVYGTSQVISKNKKNPLHLNKTLRLLCHKPLYPRNFNSKEEFAKAAWDLVSRGHVELSQL